MTSEFKKHGFIAGFSFESFITAQAVGKDVPIGVKWIQRVAYQCLAVVFIMHEALGRRLARSRHTGWSECYECGGRLELREFKQKTKWVSE